MAKRKTAEKKPDDLLGLIRERYRIMTDADSHNRNDAMLDLRFVNVPGQQWEANQKKERGDRPCYEYNKLRVTIKRVVNEMRRNRPAGKVRAVEDGDKDTADTYEGLIRNIWNVSDGDTIIDYAGEYQVGGGMGAWRINTKYSDDEAFDQDIVIEAIKNPFCLYADPAAADPLKRDAEDWILTERISRKSYESRWPDAGVADFDEIDNFDHRVEWMDDETVRIAEYWYKVPKLKNIALLSSGETVDMEDMGELPPGVTITRKRQVKSNQIMMCIVGGGNAILEGPTEWAGSQFPFVMVYGEWLVIDGRIYWHGLTRFAKDSQRAYNVARTAITETIASAPQSKFWATPEQAKGHTEKWAVAHKELMPFMLFNADPKSPGPPQRMAGADVPVALIQESQIASNEIKEVTGIFDASLGNRSNETSGVAISARQNQGELATFNFADNMGKAIRRTWELLIDLIPKVYDTERSVRILGIDGAEKYVKLNTMTVDPHTGEQKPVNDLTRGKYDTTVTVGPSFSTQRQEASETYMNIAQAFPPLMQFAGDYVFKAMDLPYADQIADRLKFMLPPQIQQAEQSGKEIPPEVQQMMAQAQQAMDQVHQQGQMVQQAAQEAQAEVAKAKEAKANAQTQISQIDVAMANLKVQEANLATDVANFKTLVAETQAKMGDTQEAQVVASDREFLSNQITAALTDIQQQSQQFSAQAMGMITDMQTRSQPQVIVPHKPRIVSMKAKRVNGELHATPVYEDQVPQ